VETILNITQFNLSYDEKRLFKEFSDSGMPLSLFLVEVRFYYPQLSKNKHLEIAKKLLLSLIEKKLLVLCKLTPQNTKNYVYEVNDSTIMNPQDVDKHISKDISWKQYIDPNDQTISYEIATTDLGEKLLDMLFDTKKPTKSNT